MDHHTIWVWVLFHVFVISMLAVDLGVFHRREHAIGVKEALGWTGVWVALAMVFCLVILFWGHDLGLIGYTRTGERLSEGRTAIDFLTAYLIEESLSMDNLFVFLLVFKFFAIPPRYQHKVLFWGILGALVMRLSFVLAGVTLLKHFEWIGYIFGAILLITGVRLWISGDAEVNPERNIVLRLFKRIMPVQDDFAGGRFAVKREWKSARGKGEGKGGMGLRWVATPLLVTLIVVETTDVIFAVDSVPAVLSVTSDPFIAYSSNVFAVLGLRALYFALAGIMPLFKDLHYGLSFILIFVGGKMIAEQLFHLPEWMHFLSLGVVGGTLLLSVLTSVLRHREEVELDGESKEDRETEDGRTEG
jgi:tellurite resistance protein TerC